MAERLLIDDYYDEFCLACSNNNKGLFIADLKKAYIRVKGLFKSDIEIRGVRNCNGALWYAGNNEVGCGVYIDDDFVILKSISAKDFFGNSDIEDCNIALLNVVPIDNRLQTYICAVAYAGNNRFYYSSAIIDLEGVLYNGDFTFPKEINRKINTKKVNIIENKSSEPSYLNRKKVVTKKSEARKNLYKELRSDLINLKVISSDVKDFLEIATGNNRSYYLTSNGIVNVNGKVMYEIDEDIDIDLENVFINYSISFSFYNSKEHFPLKITFYINEEDKEETDIFPYVVPEEMVYMFVPLNSKDNRGLSCNIENSYSIHIPKEDGQDNYSYCSYRDSHKNNRDLTVNLKSAIIKYYFAEIDKIPDGTLDEQDEDINVVTSYAIIHKYFS